MSEEHIQHLTEIIQNRQSIFPAQFTGEEISRDAVDWMLKNATQAPSHRRTNPWRFHVVPKAELHSLSTFFKKTYKQHQPPESFNEQKLASYDKKMAACSHVFILCAQHDPKGSVPEWEELASLSCGLQNIYLSVTAAGFGGYWSTPKLMIDHIEDFIDLNDGESCYGFFYLGVPQANLPPVPEREEQANYVTWHEPISND